MKFIVLLTIFVGAQTVFAQGGRGNGWQFYAFFGDYEVSRYDASCCRLSKSVKVGFQHTNEFPSIEITSLF